MSQFTPQPETQSLKRQRLWFGLLLLLLLALRLILNLGERSLWGDEGWSVRFSYGDSVQETVFEMVEDRHPPLYFVLLDVWRNLTSDDEMTMRLLSVFAALLMSAIMIQLGRALFGSTVGLFAALILILMDKQIVFSQEVRHYTWLMLTAIAATWALLLWLRDDSPKKGRSLVFVACLIAGLYTHSLFTVVMLSQCLYALLTLRSFKRLLKLASLYLCAVIAFLPWLYISAYQYLTKGGVTPSLPLEWASIEYLAPQMLGRPLVLTIGLTLLALLSPWLLTPGWRENRPALKAVLLPALGLFTPLALVLLITGDDVTLLNDRNLAIILPPLALLMGLGISSFKGYSRLMLLVFIILNGLFTVDSDYVSPPWREIAQTIAYNQIENQPVLVDVGGADAAISYHLYQELGRDADLISIYDLRLNPGENPLARLRFELLNEVDGFWYVHWADAFYTDAIFEWGYVRTAIQRYPYFEGEIYIYRFDKQENLGTELATFGEIISLHGVNVRSNETEKSWDVAFWWSSTESLANDYIISTYLLDEDGQRLGQHDAPPFNGFAPTSSWRPQNFYFDVHAIPISDGAGVARWLAVKLYHSDNHGLLGLADDTEEFLIALD